MTNAKTLIDLLAKVEAGDNQSPFWKVWLPENKDGHMAFLAHSAYHGSLDAAKALHEAVLPGWEWGITCGGAYGSIATVSDLDNGAHRHPSLISPARAWLIAILRALIAQDAP